MSAEIDERVVSMKFDNAQFEKGVEETSKSLDKFKKKLDFDGQDKSFRQLEKSINSANLDGLASAADRVSIKFNAMAAAGYAAVQHIVDKAMNSTEALVKSLSVDQISKGWSKYAEKTTSVQTIMAATGKDIETVNDQLKKLLWFADETSYSFTDMTNGIGKFTANGQDLAKSTKAMQGIATWAAISGQRAETASRAIFNVAQAIGVGYMGVADWKSIELANMATKDFKQNVIDLGVQMGKLEKITDEAGNTMYKALNSKDTFDANSMRESLKDKWFDAELMVSVLNKYGGYADKLGDIYAEMGEEVPTSKIIEDIEKMAKGQETSIEYTAKAKKMLLELKDEWNDVGAKSFAAAQMAKTYEDAIEATKDATSTAWMNIFESIFGNFEEARVEWTLLANDLWEVFVPSLISIKDLTQEAFGTDNVLFHNILKSTGLEGDVIMANLKAMGLEANAFTQDVAESAQSFEDLVKNGNVSTDLLAASLESLKKGVMSYTVAENGQIKTHYKKLALDEQQIEHINTIIADLRSEKSAYQELIDAYGKKKGRDYLFDAIHNTLQSIVEIMNNLGAGIGKVFGKSASDIFEWLQKLAEKSEEFYNKFSDPILVDRLQDIGQAVGSVFKLAISLFRTVGNGIKKILSAAGISFDLITDIAAAFGLIVNGATNATGELTVLSDIFDLIASAVKVITIPIKNLFNFIKTEWENFAKKGKEASPLIAGIVDLLTGAMSIIRLTVKFISTLGNTIANVLTQGKSATSIIGSIIGIIASLIGKIGSFFSWLEKVEEETGAFSKVAGYLGVILNFLKGIISGVAETLGAFLSKIGEKITKFKLLNDGLSDSSDNFAVFKENCEKALEAFLKWKDDAVVNIGNFFSNMGGWFVSAAGWFQKVFVPIGAWFANTFGPILHNIWEYISGMTFNDLRDVLTLVQSLANGALLGALTHKVGKFFESAGKVSESFGNAISNLFNKLFTATKETKAEATLKMAKAVMLLTGAIFALSLIPSEKVYVSTVPIIWLVNALSTAMSTMYSKLQSVQGVSARIKGVKDIIFNLGGISEIFAAKVKIDGIKNIAIAVAILAGAVAGLAFVGKYAGTTNLASAAAVISALTGLISLIAQIAFKASEMKKTTANMQQAGQQITQNITKFSDSFAFSVKVFGEEIGQALKQYSIAATFVGIAAFVLSLTGAIAAITALAAWNPEAVRFACLVVAGMLAGILTIMVAMRMLIKKIKTSTLIQAAAMMNVLSGTLIAMTGAIAAIAYVVKEVGWFNALVGMGLIAGLVTAMTICVSIMNRSQRALMGAKKSGAAILIACLALTSVAGSIAIVANVVKAVKWKNALIGFGILSGLIIIIGGVIAALAAVNHATGGGILKAAGAIVVMAGALTVLAGALTVIGAVGAIPIAIAIIEVAVALGVFLVAGIALAPVKYTLLAVAAAVLVFGVGLTLAAASLGVMSVGILQMCGALAVLGAMSGDTLKNASSNIWTFINSMIEGIPTAMDGIIKVIGQFFKSLGSIMPEIGTFIYQVISMIVLAIYDNVTNIADTFIALFIAVLELVKDKIGTIVGLIIDIIVEVIEGLADGVPDFINSLLKLVNKIVDGLAEAFDKVDVKALMKAVAAVATLAGLTAALAMVTATAPLAFVGTLFLAAITAELVTVVPSLTGLMETLRSAKLSIEDFDILLKFAEVMVLLALAGRSIPQTSSGSFYQLITGSQNVEEFAKQVKKSAKQLNRAINVLNAGSFKDNNQRKILKAYAKTIVALANAADEVPTTGWSLKRLLLGDNNLGDFANDVVAMANALDQISAGTQDESGNNILKTFDKDIVIKYADCITALAEAADKVPNTFPGIVALFTGDNNVLLFSMFISETAKILSNVSKYLDSHPFDKDALVSVANVISELATAAGKVPETGGLKSWFTGDKNVADFAKGLAKAVKPLATFYTELKKNGLALYSSISIDMFIKALGDIANVANDLPEKSGWIKKAWSDKTTIPEFCDQLLSIVPKLIAFADQSKDISLKNLQHGTGAVKKMVELMTGVELPPKDTLKGWLGFFGETNHYNLGEFGEQVKTCFAVFRDIQTFASEYENGSDDFDMNAITKITEGMGVFVDFCKEIYGASDSLSSLGLLESAMQRFGLESIGKFINSFEGAIPDANTRLKDAAGLLFSGILSKQEDLDNTFKRLFDNMFTNTASDLYQAFETAGRNYISGLIIGMQNSEELDAVAEAAANGGQVALDSTMKTLDEHSPSKITELMGVNFMRGLVNGIANEDQLRQVRQAAKDAGMAGLNSLSDLDLKKKIQKKWKRDQKYIFADVEADAETNTNNIITKVVDVINTSGADITNASGNVLDLVTGNIKDAGGNIVATAKDIGTDSGDQLFGGFSDQLMGFDMSNLKDLWSGKLGDFTIIARENGLAAGDAWSRGVSEAMRDSKLFSMATDKDKELMSHMPSADAKKYLEAQYSKEMAEWDEYVVSSAGETGNEAGNSLTDGITKGTSGGASKVKDTIKKKVIPAFNFAKSRKFKKTIVGAGDELTKAFTDSVKIFGDRHLKKTTEQIDKFAKSLAKVYGKSTKSYKSDKQQMTDLLSYYEYLAVKRERLLKQSAKLEAAYKKERASLTDEEAIKKLDAEYKANKKIQDKKLNRNKKDMNFTRKVEKSYEDSAAAMGNVAYYQNNLKKGVYDYSKVYNKAQKSITDSMGLTKGSKKVVNEYIKSIYKESDAYEEDQRNLEDATENYKNVRKELKALKKQRDKLKNTGTKKELNQVMKEIASKEKELEEAGRNMEDAAKQVGDNLTEAFDSIWGNIHKNITAGFDLFKQSMDTGINLLNVAAEKASSKIDIDTAFNKGLTKNTNVIDILTASAETGIEIFHKFNDSATESTRSLLRNMKSQIEGVRGIATGLEQLAGRGASKELINYIKSMGTQAASYLKVFSRMSSEQIQEANSWFAESEKEAANTLIANMKSMYEERANYNANIENLIARGLNDGIIEAIKEKGIEDQTMLKDYMRLSDEQIREANSWYEKAKNEEVSSKNDNIIQALDDELTAVEQWQKDIDKVTGDGKVSQAWIDKMQEAGPKSREILDAFMTMTEEQIVKMNERLAAATGDGAGSAADALIAAQESKLADYASYQEKLGTLLARNGIGEAMRKQLSSLTINDIDKINAYLEMTDEQIEKSNSMFEKEAEYTKDALISNYRKSAIATEQWADDIIALSGTLSKETLIELMDMGIDASSAYIDAFKQMSPDELTAVEQAFKDKTGLGDATLGRLLTAVSQAGGELSDKAKKSFLDNWSGVGDEAIQQLVESLAGTGEETTDAAAETAENASNSSAMAKVGENTGKAVVKGLKKSKKSMVETMTKNLDAVIEAAKAKNDEFKKRGRVIGKQIINGIEAKKEPMLTAINGLADLITETFENKKPDFISAGQNAGNSVTSGINDALSSVYEDAVMAGTNLIDGLVIGVNDAAAIGKLNKAMKSMMNGALQAARDEAGIHSPSTVAREMGRFIDIGFAGGLTAYASMVESSSEEVANKALTGLSGAIQKISETVENDIDTQPVIRPVLDLSNIQDGASSINKQLSGLNVSGTFGTASSLSLGMNASRANQTSTADALENLRASLSGMPSGGDVTQNNTFNITGDNPREIANQVSKILQQQVERRGAVWA